MNADILGRIKRLTVARFLKRWRTEATGLADEISRPRPSLKPAIAFKLPTGLQRSGQADLVSRHEYPNRRETISLTQCAGFDGFLVVLCQTAINR